MQNKIRFVSEWTRALRRERERETERKWSSFIANDELLELFIDLFSGFDRCACTTYMRYVHTNEMKNGKNKTAATASTIAASAIGMKLCCILLICTCVNVYLSVCVFVCAAISEHGTGNVTFNNRTPHCLLSYMLETIIKSITQISFRWTPYIRLNIYSQITVHFVSQRNSVTLFSYQFHGSIFTLIVNFFPYLAFASLLSVQWAYIIYGLRVRVRACVRFFLLYLFAFKWTDRSATGFSHA